ncbi:hypothetical protein [Modestobacter sp. URMC 112]
MAANVVRPSSEGTGVAERVTALAGAASVVVAFVGISFADVGGKGLDPTMTPETLAGGLHEHVDALTTGASLLSLAAVLAVLFAGPLWWRLRAAAGWVAAMGVAGAVLAGTLWIDLAAESIALATAADLGDGVTARVLLTAGWESARIGAVPSLVMVTAAVVAGFGYGVFAGWFRWFSALMLVPLVVALAPVGPAGLLGFTSGGLWVLVASLHFAMQEPAR